MGITDYNKKLDEIDRDIIEFMQEFGFYKVSEMEVKEPKDFTTKISGVVITAFLIMTLITIFLK